MLGLITYMLGKHLLALSHTEVDATGQSYYGENNLYFISGDGSFDCRVALDKAGPVHDIAWGPRGDEFIVAYGFMPSRIALFNLKCEVAFQFPVESKNHIRYSPAGNLLAFGGFGNLPGNIEVWTRTGTQLKRVALIQAPSSSICEWSPSGHAILTGIVTPRLRVDNGFTLWSWQGKLLEKVPYTELYQVLWRPCPAGVKFPLVDFSKSAQLDFAANSALPKKEAYRPPGLRNTNVSSPGLKGDCKNDSKPVVAVQMATISSGLSNREKNIRRLEQKLEQIRQLKAKQADGLSLELNQMEKIKSEVDVKRELEHFKGMKE